MKRSLIIALMLFVVALKLQAQGKFISGNSFNILLPQKELAKTYEYGLGIYANYDYELSKHLAIRLDVGWNDVSGPLIVYEDKDGKTHTSYKYIYLGNHRWFESQCFNILCRNERWLFYNS